MYNLATHTSQLHIYQLVSYSQLASYLNAISPLRWCQLVGCQCKRKSTKNAGVGRDEGPRQSSLHEILGHAPIAALVASESVEWFSC